jgi:hypothetical protein
MVAVDGAAAAAVVALVAANPGERDDTYQGKHAWG